LAKYQKTPQNNNTMLRAPYTPMEQQE